MTLTNRTVLIAGGKRIGASPTGVAASGRPRYTGLRAVVRGNARRD
jgi:hypothetical protein